MPLFALDESTSRFFILGAIIYWFVVVAILFGLTLAVILLIRRSNRRRSLARAHRAAVSSTIARIARDFPVEVRSWGGPAELEDAGAIRSILRRLEAGHSSERGASVP